MTQGPQSATTLFSTPRYTSSCESAWDDFPRALDGVCFSICQCCRRALFSASVGDEAAVRASPSALQYDSPSSLSVTRKLSSLLLTSSGGNDAHAIQAPIPHPSSPIQSNPLLHHTTPHRPLPLPLSPSGTPLTFATPSPWDHTACLEPDMSCPSLPKASAPRGKLKVPPPPHDSRERALLSKKERRRKEKEKKGLPETRDSAGASRSGKTGTSHATVRLLGTL